MSPSLIGVGILVGALVTFPLAVAYVRAKLGWEAYKSAKAKVPKLRKNVWSQAGIVIKAALVAGVIISFGLWLSVNGSNDARHGSPTPAVSVTTTGR